jgi:hypothetical protein
VCFKRPESLSPTQARYPFFLRCLARSPTSVLAPCRDTAAPAHENLWIAGFGLRISDLGLPPIRPVTFPHRYECVCLLIPSPTRASSCPWNPTPFPLFHEPGIGYAGGQGRNRPLTPTLSPSEGAREIIFWGLVPGAALASLRLPRAIIFRPSGAPDWLASLG